MVSYKNGTYTVTLLDDGTKYFTGDQFNADFPDSIDLKITNKCSNGCNFCYMNSVKSDTRLVDLEKLDSILNGLPKGIEIALGGGNILETPQLTDIIDILGSKGFIINATVNQNDLPALRNNPELLKKFNAIGVSVINPKVDLLLNHPNVYAHIIVGIFPLEQFSELRKYYKKVLILGYKDLGRGKSINISEETKKDWSKFIAQTFRFGKGNLTLAFDNTAISQLGIKNIMLKSEWESFYNGPEFSHTMYVDAISGKFGPTSFTDSSELVDWNTISLIDYFKKNHVNTFI